ncbi:MAG: Gfo/Idh/MocA family oxidoreductase [Actinomycetota bacterium]|nr:Gfo/Idh/MocA family oxidoreductase [Actinomycetota bacterium]
MPPSSSEPVRWGILATGRIAHLFAQDLMLTPGAELSAVGSRRLDAARAFADEFGGVTAHGSYEELVGDPQVDAVYVATPHSMHLDNVRIALEAGKHVLCEKPVTVDVAQAEEMMRLAREHDRFLMEAMWTALHPVVLALRAGLATGRFGAPRHLRAELGSRFDGPPESRIFDPDLGASAMLDIGIYPLTFAHLLLGPAEELKALGELSPLGYDVDVGLTGRYPGGVLATMAVSMTSWSSRTASIATDLGRIEVPDSFHHPAYAVFHPLDGEPVRIDGTDPVIGRGYGNEIAEVGRCLREGLLESPFVPHSQTLLIMRQLQDVRRQVGAAAFH